MTIAFFWLAIFPMILGGIIFAIYIIILRREGKKSVNPEDKRITPEEFINEIAQHSDMDDAEAERMIEFVFSYFPGFKWRRNLPRARDAKRHRSDERIQRKDKT